MWHWILAALASVSAGPDALEREAPRAAAAVSVAYGSLARPTDRTNVEGDASSPVPPVDDGAGRDRRTDNVGSKTLPAGVSAGGVRQ